MNIFAGREVHDGIRPPLDGPSHFFDFFLNTGSNGRIPNIGVDLDQKIAPDNHRLQLRMVDVTWNNGSPTGDLIAHKFRGDLVGNAGPPRLARVLMLQTSLVGSPGCLSHLGSSHVFADGNEFHFGCNDTLAGVPQLGHWVPL